MVFGYAVEAGARSGHGGALIDSKEVIKCVGEARLCWASLATEAGARHRDLVALRACGRWRAAFVDGLVVRCRGSGHCLTTKRL